MSEEARSEWDAYPSGLKVLAVDDDPLCLKVVARMLRRCDYEVRTAENGKDALAQLRDRNLQIDLVLSDVYMPDMDGFKLLETIGLELDLPVIMMSSNGDTPVVLRGVTHGAVDFLIKPVRIEELRNVWQHVVRRRKDQAHVSQQYSGDDEVVDGNKVDKKRKEQVRRESDDQTSTKKPRVVWSVEMHQQFVNAVNSLGIDKAVPKRILDLMSVEGLTRENVASHLQKYRLYLKRVAGVRVQAPGRGKSLHGGVDPQHAFGGMLVPGAAPSQDCAAGSISEQEQLKMQLQLRQMRNPQASAVAQPPYCKQEPVDAATAAPPYGNGNAAVPGSDYTHVAPALVEVGKFEAGGAAGIHAGAQLMPLQDPGGMDAQAMPGIDPLQSFDLQSLQPLTSRELVYPEPMLSAHSGLGDLPMRHGLEAPELSHDLSHELSHDMTHLSTDVNELPVPHGEPSTSAGLPGRLEDMDSFLSMVLQPNE